MTLATILFIAFVFGTFLSTGVQLYFNQGAYSLFGAVSAADRPAYIARFEQLTALPLNLSFLVNVVGTVGLLIVRPQGLSAVWSIASLATLVVTTIITLAVAAPIYARYKNQTGDATALLSQLRRINVPRLLLALVNSAAAIAALVQVLKF